MLTQREKDFIRYWEANRLRRKKVVRQFLVGIPIGLLFVIPIVINFSSGWYRRADMEARSGDFNPVVLLIALLLIVGFTAIFYQRHQWDQYEQHYRELLARRLKEESTTADATSADATSADATTQPTIPPAPEPAPISNISPGSSADSPSPKNEATPSQTQ
ncbi:MAG TPA: hypothetical protein VNV35_00280 [Puia sp.]|jgi:hypothetical protein|nr:hypothetical protein [Puia sp.]